LLKVAPATARPSLMIEVHIPDTTKGRLPGWGRFLDASESTEDDSSLAMVSEVEAGIRDFVRNDVAYLRRPASGMPASTEPVPEPSPRGHRQQLQLVNSTRRRGFDRGNPKPDYRTRKPA
jgi:hypothetical protein